MSDIKYPHGFVTHGAIQVAVRFDEDLFNRIIDQAKKEKRTFNEMVIYLAECGKLCLDESDALEPKT